MSAWLQQQVNDLRQRISADMQARAALEGTRATPAGAAAVANEIRRLDSSIAEAAKSLASVERKMRNGP
jgi:hypothetical protein